MLRAGGKKEASEDALRGSGTEEVLNDLKEEEEFRKLRNNVRIDVLGEGHGILQGIVE